MARESRSRVHAWCQMTNHDHLVVGTPEPNLAGGMGQLKGEPTQAVNRWQRRFGDRFDGCYRAILVEKVAHVLELPRCVALNPVPARVVKGSRQWRWSSDRPMVGVEAAPPLRGASIAFAQAWDCLRLWGDRRGQIFLGGERSVDRMRATRGAGAVGHRTARDPARAALRDAAIVATDATGGDSTAQIGRRFGVKCIAVSRVVGRVDLKGDNVQA